MRRIANDYDRLAKLAEEQLVAQEAIGRKTWNRLLTLCAYCAIQALPCQKAWCSRGNGFNEQIFGAKNQVPVGKAIKNSVWTAAAAWRQFVGNS
jgi:hypothetical protein